MDKEYEALLENYEDAMMRLVMYRMAQEDGKKLLEEAEQLEANGFEVPKELDEKCLNLIRSASAERKPRLNRTNTNTDHARSHPRLRMAVRTALAAVLAATLMFTVAYAASPEFRAGVLQFFTKVEEIGTHFFFYSNGSATPEPDASNPSTINDGLSVKFTYIPDGYEKYEEFALEHGEDAIHYLFSYIDKHDEINNFSLEILPVGENSSVIVDTEDATVQSTIIHGYSGMLIEKTDAFTERNQVQCVWINETDKLFYSYFSLGISSDESQKIPNSIVINDK